MAVPVPTAIVRVEVPAPGAVIGLGLKPTVVPVGAPVADNAIGLLKPPLTVVVSVEVPRLPCATVTADGEASSVKFGGARTDKVVDPLTLPDVAEMVVDPILTPVATPAEVMVATEVLEECQVVVDVKF